MIHIYDIKLRQENSASLHHYGFQIKSWAHYQLCDQSKPINEIKIRGGRLAGDGGGEIKQLIHSEALVLEKNRKHYGKYQSKNLLFSTEFVPSK